MFDMENKEYNFAKIEKKWQDIWDYKESFKFDEKATNRKKRYVLEMLPYPSGSIHMGHLRNYAIGDVVARHYFKLGYNVLHPMGFDAFGLPAENAANERGIHPADWTYKNIEEMEKQIKMIGFSYDWSRKIATCDPEYYKHEQRMFTKFFEAGIAYKKESYVNWDPVDQTVLANEQVVDGKGWRSGALVEKKLMNQWFLKISDYAERLLDGLKTLEEWPQKIRLMQEKWIGKSSGAIIKFDLKNSVEYNVKNIEVFSTRPDTLFGASFVAISAEHPLAEEIARNNKEAQSFIEECIRAGGVSEDVMEKAEKLGYNTGVSVCHPFDKDRTIPVYIANFVLMGYGTGAVFGCPAHDQRDYEFATKYSLPITQVVWNGEESDIVELGSAYTGSGKIIHSEFLNDLEVEVAKKVAIERLADLGLGCEEVSYRLRDWGVSRQRYWGCPIPILYLEDGTVVPVPEEDLPVLPPEDVKFEGKGNPLENHPTWKYTTYKGQKAIRETDTLDTFFESSWYFFRYICPHLEDKAFDKEAVDRIMPVDNYIGGIEHAVLHLLYARFFTMALSDVGYCKVQEPFKGLYTQGMVCHQTYQTQDNKWLYPTEVYKDDGKYKHVSTQDLIKVGPSQKMSKSKRNTVDPVNIVTKYGADTARLFMLSDSPPERDLEWTDSGIEASYKYLSKIWKMCQDFAEYKAKNKSNDGYSIDSLTEEEKDVLTKTHQLLQDYPKLVNDFHFNKIIARLREISNSLEKLDYSSSVSSYSIYKESLEAFLQMFNPFIPHITEELYNIVNINNNGDIISLTSYPEINHDVLIKRTMNITVQINGKTRGILTLPINSSQDEIETLAKNDNTIAKYLYNKKLLKVIYVKDKIISFVVSEL